MTIAVRFFTIRYCNYRQTKLPSWLKQQGKLLVLPNYEKHIFLPIKKLNFIHSEKEIAKVTKSDMLQ